MTQLLRPLLRRSVMAAALIASVLVSTSVGAQDSRRMTVGDLIARIDRLEREVASLRITPVGTSDDTVQRLQQIETEMRRMTGTVERLEYEARQRADQLEARLEALEAQFGARLGALEDAPAPAAPLAQAPPPSPVQPRQPLTPQLPNAQAALSPILAPSAQAGFAAPRPTQSVSGLTSPNFGDLPPDLSAIPGAPTFGSAPAAQLPLPLPNAGATFSLDGGASAPALQAAPSFPALTAPAAPVLNAQPQLALTAPQAPLPPIFGGQQGAVAAPQAPAALAPQPTPNGGASEGPEIAYRAGLDLLNLGLFDDAGLKFEELIAAYPDHPAAGQAMFWLGDMHLRLGRNDVAAKSFLDSFKRWPDGEKAPESLLKLGMTLGSLGQRDEACLTFTRFASRYPGARADLLQRADLEARRTNCGG